MEELERVGTQGADLSGAFRSSHNELLAIVPRYRAGKSLPKIGISAVFFPTNRRTGEAGDGLGLAVQCARNHEVPLVVLRSGAATDQPYPHALVPDTPCVVIDLPKGPWATLPRLATELSPLGRSPARREESWKRNTALALGNLCAYESILFIDDDLSNHPSCECHGCEISDEVHFAERLEDVRADMAGCPALMAAGFVQKNFHDNSVVCHVRRLLGRPQDCFVSSAGLVVRCTEDMPFFPASYNCDWQFFFPLINDGTHSFPSSVVKIAGTLHQAAFDPMSTHRAKSEELADAFAEGLYNLLGGSREDCLARAYSRAYWASVLAERRALLLSLLNDIHRLYPLPHPAPFEYRKAEECLFSALAVQIGAADAPDVLAAYFRSWCEDLQVWRTYLTSMKGNSRNSLKAAIHSLGLHPYASWVHE